ncbi:Transcription factor [Niveomyces insectorum RCEF 264]|uniref:Transcription factor n=1 Tax=Niveomyces insectorum RCEF 264 TaxID=1081102 RepID=A0A167ZXL4_9HYPO|nr:Transcription factor [Niveomyces insectorum RCEF 264]
MPVQTSDEGDLEVGDNTRRPLRKQVRVMSKTCEICKAKKSRCDSSRPQCDTCRRKGITCIYKEKGQPGLRPGYGKAVEGRLSMLEENMAKMSQSIQDVLRHVQAGPSPALSAHTPYDAGGGSGGDGGSGSNPGDRPLPQPPAPPPQPQPHPQQQLVSSVPAYGEMPPLMNDMPTPLDNIVPGVPASLVDPTLPPRAVLDELVELFFQNVYAWAPLFHEPTFRSNMLAADRQLLLHGMVVLGFRFWTKPEPPPAVREGHVKAAREKLLVETINSTSLVAYQALALLAIDAVGDGPGPRTWNIMAMLVACARQLHLDHSPSPGADGARSSLVTNEDPQTDASLSAIEAEEKRRLFWTIYSLDRFSSVSLGQSSSIDSRHIRLQYPARDDDWGQSVPLEWFQGSPLPMRPALTQYPISTWQYYIDILSLVDQSNQLLVQPMNLSLPAQCQEWQSKFRRLDILAMTWLENLPVEVREPPASFDPMWHILHATFYLINMRMYTVAAFPATASPYMRPSPSARSQLRKSVEKVACLAATLQPEQVHQLGPMFAFVVWVAARSLIILWTTGHEVTYGTMMPADLTTLLRSLNQSALYWPCAECYADIIQLILDTKNNPGGPTGIDIFNDTRRTAYGLRSRLGTIASYRFTRDLFTTADDFFDGVLAGLVELPPTSQLGLINPSPDFDRDWL